MWTSLPATVAVLALSLGLADARLHLKRSYTGKVSQGPSSLPASGVVVDGPGPVITVTVQPMPVGTYDGVFYSGVSTGTGTPSGVFPTGSKLTVTGFPDFTKPPVISIPTSTSSSRARTTRFPDFTGSPVISIPSSTRIRTTTKSRKPTTTSTADPIPSQTETPFLRGVNLGGWLVLEKWMNDEAFTGAFSGASDQYTFDSIPGSEAALEQHWSTFFTESDIATIAATGINALRIPIGYWAYDNSGTPYKQGADAYMEKAIGWARKYSMKVWVDCHGSPGSQNGFDNSGEAGSVNWQKGDNMGKSIAVLKTMAAKYGKLEYADVVVGLQLVNEPISWGDNDFGKTKSWTEEAYKAVRAVVENQNMVIVMHDGFMGGLEWTGVASSVLSSGASRSFGIDEHLYQLFTDAYNAMDQSQHITAACGWASNLAAANQQFPVYVGEWSAATNICVNPDGSTIAGKTCWVDGCQCQSDDWTKWNSNMIDQMRRFVEAQLDVFESSTSGYFMWAAKGPGGWGFLNGISNGVIPNPVTSRKFGKQCGGGTRREVRGSIGARETF